MSVYSLDPNQIFNVQYYQLCQLGNRFVKSLLIDTLDRLNITNIFESSFSDDEIVEILQLKGDVVDHFKWVIGFLAENKVLECVADKKFLLKKSEVVNNVHYSVIEEEMLHLNEGVGAFCQMTKKMVEQYPLLIKGKPGKEILFSNNGLELWTKYFSNNNPGYVVHNLFGAYFISKALRKISGDFSILELGSGTCSASEAVFLRLEEEGAHFAGKYICSDTSLVLLRMAEKTIRSHFYKHGYNIQTMQLNFNHSFSSKLAPVDLIYAVNSLHASKDILFTMREIYALLKDGGTLVVSECVRSTGNNYPFQEVVFSALKDYNNALRPCEFRMLPGFLSSASWLSILKRVGFREVRLASNSDCSLDNNNPPSQSAVVAMGIK